MLMSHNDHHGIFTDNIITFTEVIERTIILFIFYFHTNENEAFHIMLQATTTSYNNDRVSDLLV